MYEDAGVVSRGACNHDVAVDRDRQYGKPVIIGVLANQVDATGRAEKICLVALREKFGKSLQKRDRPREVYVNVGRIPTDAPGIAEDSSRGADGSVAPLARLAAFGMKVLRLRQALDKPVDPFRLNEKIVCYPYLFLTCLLFCRRQ